MRPVWLVLAWCGLAVSANAQMPSVQSPSFQATPLPPLQEQQPPAARALAPPASNTPKPIAPAATAERSDIWVPAGVAKLQALDKVNAQTTALTIKVGQSAAFGSLTIVVKACVIRPPDQPRDAAVYLDVTDSHPDSPGFAGWMLENEPAASMMQHPIYDLRVTGCG